jgi:hypothetical protein
MPLKKIKKIKKSIVLSVKKCKLAFLFTKNKGFSMIINIELEFFFEKEEQLTESTLKDSVYTLLTELMESDELLYTVEETENAKLILEVTE